MNELVRWQSACAEVILACELLVSAGLQLPVQGTISDDHQSDLNSQILILSSAKYGKCACAYSIDDVKPSQSIARR